MSEFLLFIKQVFPVEKEAAMGSLAGIFGVMAEYLFGEWNDALETLIFFMIVDYVSGLIAAYCNAGLKLDSRIGFRGICKKIMILLLVAVAHFVDRATGQVVICTAVTWFFIGNEGLSIIENAAKAGLPIPKKLQNTLAQLTEEKEERKGEK